MDQKNNDNSEIISLNRVNVLAEILDTVWVVIVVVMILLA